MFLSKEFYPISFKTISHIQLCPINPKLATWANLLFSELFPLKSSRILFRKRKQWPKAFISSCYSGASCLSGKSALPPTGKAPQRPVPRARAQVPKPLAILQHLGRMMTTTRQPANTHTHTRKTSMIQRKGL